MVFLSSGEVEVLADTVDQENNNTHKEALVTTLSEHSFFGEMSLLDDSHRSTASIRVKEYCEGWLLSIEAYHQVPT